MQKFELKIGQTTHRGVEVRVGFSQGDARTGKEMRLKIFGVEAKTDAFGKYYLLRYRRQRTRHRRAHVVGKALYEIKDRRIQFAVGGLRDGDLARVRIDCLGLDLYFVANGDETADDDYISTNGFAAGSGFGFVERGG